MERMTGLAEVLQPIARSPRLGESQDDLGCNTAEQCKKIGGKLTVSLHPLQPYLINHYN